MKLDYWEICISCEESTSDILVAMLAEANFESFLFEESQLLAYAQVAYYPHKLLLEETLNVIMSDLPFTISFSIRKIEQQNWNETWEKQFEPIIVENKCIIRAPFHTPSKDLLNVIIEPKMSFGTGHHQTTYMMLNQLFIQDIANKSILDMGCGTAVLAIVCEKLNAASVVAIDIEDWAFENSLENCVLNNCSNVEVRLGGVEKILSNTFNLILANINKNILKLDMHRYVNSLEKHGKLLISGFFSTDVDELVELAESLKLTLESVITKDEWALVVLIKK